MNLQPNFFTMNTFHKLTLSLLAASSLVLPSLAQVENKSGVPYPDAPTLHDKHAGIKGRQIAEYADQRGQGWFDEVSKGRMTLFDAGGDSVVRTFSRTVLEGAEKGDKVIVRFLTPAEIKGVAALTHEKPGDSDDNWLFLPASKRVRRISGANKTASFQGTEFTYEDLSDLEIDEYKWRNLGEATIDRDGKKVDVFRVEAVPTYKNTAYSRLVVFYNKAEWRRERIEYYDLSKTLLKTQESSDWKHYHGRFWRSNQFVMSNHQTKKRTELAFDSVYLNLSLYKSRRTGKARSNLNDSVFTTQALQK